MSDLLVGTGATLDTIGDFLSITEVGGNSIVSVDLDGSGAGSGQHLVTLAGVTNAMPRPIAERPDRHLTDELNDAVAPGRERLGS